MATKPKLGMPASRMAIVVTDENPDAYEGDWRRPLAPVEQSASPDGPGFLGRAADLAITGVKGAIGVPEAAVGLADIATGGRVGRALENEGGAIGFRPKEARAFLDTLYSPQQKAAFKAVQDASDPNAGLIENIGNVAAAALRNPSTIVHSVGESLPLMGAGGVLARGALAALPAKAAAAPASVIAAAGLGEGVTAAGSNAEQMRQETADGLLTPKQAALAAGSGLATAGIAAVAARAARALGIGDVDVMLASGTTKVSAESQKGFVRRVLEGVVTEGLMEELPQSIQEQVTQNYALGKPLDEGVDIAAVMGTLAGGAMGGGVQMLTRRVPEVGTLSKAANESTPPAAPAKPSEPIKLVLSPQVERSLLDHANERGQAIERKAKGEKGQKITGPDGKEITTPDIPPEFLTPDEMRERDFLKEAGGDVQALARRYPELLQPSVPQDEPAPQLQPAAPPAAEVVPEAAAAPADDGFDASPPHLPTDIIGPRGKPFEFIKQAQVALKKQADPAGFTIERVEGGYALRPRPEQTDATTPSQPAEVAQSADASGGHQPGPSASVAAEQPGTGQPGPATDQPAPADTGRRGSSGEAVPVVDAGAGADAVGFQATTAPVPPVESDSTAAPTPAQPDAGATAPNTGSESVAPEPEAPAPADQHAQAIADARAALPAGYAIDDNGKVLTVKRGDETLVHGIGRGGADEALRQAVRDFEKQAKVDSESTLAAPEAPAQSQDGGTPTEGPGVQATTALAAPDDGSPEARWTRATEADRTAVLGKAGWSVTPPSLSTQRMLKVPWDKMTPSQRDRLTAAMGEQEPAATEPKQEPQKAKAENYVTAFGRAMHEAGMEMDGTDTRSWSANVGERGEVHARIDERGSTVVYTVYSLQDGKDHFKIATVKLEDATAAIKEYRDTLLADEAKPAQAAAEKAARPTLDTPEGRNAVAQQVADRLIGGDGFATIIEARKFIGDLIGKKIEPATLDAKLADETVEVGVVLAAREIVSAARKQGRGDEVIYDRLVGLYKAQPNLGVRSSTSVREQAYSTPAPLAFLASRLAGITEDSRVGEPTAGNGMLVMEVAPANAVVNELNQQRAGNLRAMGFEPTTHNAATTPLAPAKSLDAEVMNPPFGTVKDDNRETIRYEVKPGYDTIEVDHAIAFEALDALKDDGRAVLILGGVDESDPERIRDGYRGKGKREFYYHLYQNYRVVDHFTVDGDLYSRQGAGYPVDVVVIQGRGKAPRTLPAADLPQRFDSWESLKEKLHGQDSVASGGRSDPDRSDDRARGGDGAAVVDGAGRPADGNGDAGAGPRGSDAVRGTSAGRGDTGQPTADRGGADSAQPRTANGTDEEPGGRVPGEGGSRRPGGQVGDGGTDRLGPVAADGQVGTERVKSGLKDRRGQEQETATQSAYTPRSKVASVGTLVPVNMRDPVQASLDRVQAEVGDLDAYVAEKLGYKPDELADYFSAEQVDALALGIYNAEHGSGFIVGDQTGVGKGRIVAAMIRYAIRKGVTPIFVTEKPNLYADMIRDLDDIGMADELGLESGKPDILITNDDPVPFELLRKDGDDVVQRQFMLKPPARGAALAKAMSEMVESDKLDPYKVIFTTYNQLQTVKGKQTDRMRAVQHFGDGGYVIFDESHNAGGNDAGQARTKQQRAQAAAGQTLVTGRASFARGLVGRAGGTFFSSATYAKRPDVMDLYSSTNMMQAVDRPADLAPAIKAGGVPLQQSVATMLTEDGQYIRRERTFAGVTYETRATKVDRQTAENMATAMRRILAFSRAKERAVKELQKAADREAARVSVEGEKTQVQGANFGSIMHNLIDQMLLALKARDSVDFAIERLKAGEKAVLTVSNTMGSFLGDYAKEMGLRNGEPVALSFKDLYQRYLEKQRIVKIKKPSGMTDEYRLTDEDLGEAGTRMFDDIQAFLEGAGFGEAPISPIDYMHAELRKAGFKTDEITGRTVGLDYSTGTPKLMGRQANIKQRLAAIRGFNAGDIDALILNQSGSTGLSLHASEKVKDQRPRRMIVVQAEKNIDTHMQMLGRVHRTGQVVVPAYTQAMADIPAETRPAAVLLKKMASLNANTTASRKSAVTAEGVVDFMNDYGAQVVHEYLMDNPDVHQAIGGNQVLALADDPTEADEADIRKFTGYIPILPIEQQEQVYADLIERYNELIAREDSMGTNKLEARAIDLDAKQLSTETVTPRKEGNSRFAEPASMERLDVKRTVKPMTGEEVRAAVAEGLGGKTADQQARELMKSAQEATDAYRVARIEQLRSHGADQPRLQREDDTIRLQLGQVRSMLQTYPPGTPVTITDKNGGIVYGVVTSVADTKKTKNPAAGSSWKMTLALANGDARSITINFGQIGTAVRLTVQHGQIPAVSHDGETEWVRIPDLFDRGATVRREKRWMVTGNILAGFAKYPGQIVSYTKDDGTIGQGVLMPRSFDFEKAKKQSKAAFSTVEQARQFFEAAGRGATLGMPDSSIKIVSDGYGSMDFLTPSSKKDGGRFYLDKGLTDAIGGDFFKSGQVMRARVHNADDGYAGIAYLLGEDDVKLVALNHQPEANKVLGIGEPDKPPPSGGKPAASRGDAAPAARGAAEVRATADRIAARWNNAPPVEVLDSIADAPKALQDEEAVALKAGTDPAEAYYHDGKVYLLADRLPTDKDVARVLAHETLGHHGMRSTFGPEFGLLLDRMTVLNGGKVRTAAARLKLDFEKQSDRRMATEEVLAYMAQEQPELGWVQRALAAVRTWARAHIPGFGKMAFSDAELIRDFIIPARRWVESGQPKAKVESDSTPAASRGLAASLLDGLNNVRDVRLHAGYTVNDFLDRDGKLHWWHKSVGTMFNLAQKSAPFKRVFDAVQNFLHDASYYSAESAALAPDILPKLESLKDIAKAALSADDTKALAGPVFEGTLLWRRDENGKPIRMEDVDQNVRLDDKAHALLRGRHVTPEVLRMWQGHTIDQYEKIIDGKYEREFLRPGIVFKPAELKQHFGLTDQQVKHYQQYRAAMDKSIADLALTEMLRYAGKDVDSLREQALTMPMADAAVLLRDHLFELAAADPGRAEALNAAGNRMVEIADHAKRMQAEGYAPLSRFGTYTLEATTEDGERFFSLYETTRERARAVRQLQAAGATDIRTGTMSQEDHKLFNGISPETAALFGEMLGLDEQGDEAKDRAFAEYVKRGIANRSAMKRLLRRKGIAGFSEDAGRVLASFIVSNGRKTANNIHARELDQAISDIPKEQGELKDAAVKLREYVRNPQEEAHRFRALLFAQYLGGSVASAMVNATQPFAVSFPYLSQFGGVRKAGTRLAAALKMLGKDGTGNAALDAALKHSEEEGIVSPQEIHSLQGQAMGRAQLTSGDGTRLGDAQAAASNALSKLALAWGKVFGVAEQFNRRLTFIAAYNTAVEEGIANPAKFAEKAVNETQFVYNKGSRPRWARGAVGSVAFTFKQYSINYVELLVRMATAGEPGSPERAAGRRAAVLALAVLFMLAGAEGLPFVEDVEDVIDGALQRMGYNFSSKQQMRELLARAIGRDGAQIIASGMSGLPGAPVDFSGRLSMGNLVPGTGIFQKKTDRTRDLMEIAGAGGDMMKRAFTAGEQLLAGDPMRAATTAMPVAGRNLVKMIDMLDQGMYRDERGRKVIDTNAFEAVAKGIGFQPRSVHDVQEASYEGQRQKALYTLAASEIREKWARAKFEDDDDLLAEAKADIDAWNRRNPGQPIRPNMPAILRRVREMRKSKLERIADTAPAAIRANVRAQIAEATQ